MKAIRRVGVVVVAYNRPASLVMTLRSVSQLRVPSGASVEIVISQDGPPDRLVDNALTNFRLPFPTRRIRHESNLGLREHVLLCGDLVSDYDLLVVIEDDVVVAPAALEVLVPAVEAYQDDPLIQQFSLYSPSLMEATRSPFAPIDDGNPGFLLRVPQSWGQAYLPAQWRAFRDFVADPGNAVLLHGKDLPANAYSWPRDSSWKRDHFCFMMATEGYSWIPRASLSSQTGAAGTHFRNPTTKMSVPMQVASGKSRFPPVEELSRYDEYGELEWKSLARYADELCRFDGTVDLYGVRPLDRVGTPYVLTSRKSRRALKTFGSDLLPLELNIILGQPGQSISLTRAEDVTQPQPLPLSTVIRWRPSKFAVESLLRRLESASSLGYRRSLLGRLRTRVFSQRK